MKTKKQFNRYHSEIYFPESYPDMMMEFIETFKGDVDLTNHAAGELYEDKRGQIPLPSYDEILDSSNKVVEIHELTNKTGRIQRTVFRIGHLSEKYDYTYVIARGGVVVTAWANDKGDNHRLTNTSVRYIKGPNDKRILQGPGSY